MENAHLCNDAALLGISSILILNVILGYLVECSFGLFSVQFNLQDVRLILGVILL